MLLTGIPAQKQLFRRAFWFFFSLIEPEGVIAVIEGS